MIYGRRLEIFMPSGNDPGPKPKDTRLLTREAGFWDRRKTAAKIMGEREGHGRLTRR